MNKQGWGSFLDLCINTTEKKDLDMLFDLFFTPEEKDNLALRYLIIQELLQDKKSQRDIAKTLNVSIAKITRGSNELKRISPKLLASLRSKM
jgi:TrpR family trp operon transcriptional repressor